MIENNRFSRELVQATRIQYRDPAVRREKVKALYQKFGAEEVRFDGKVIGWRVKESFICFKRSFKTEADALLILGLSKFKRNYKCNEVYQCPKCNQWHATSKGHLAGTHK
ncbi:hypothetical protein D3C76_429860 [compost metagenome]